MLLALFTVLTGSAQVVRVVLNSTAAACPAHAIRLGDQLLPLGLRAAPAPLFDVLVCECALPLTAATGTLDACSPSQDHAEKM